MATETFAEFLNRLKEIHEKEVQGLQTKLNQLTEERCRDTQRIEELFAKNHQLREQQKLLKENVKVLENRLRAGLCDRCQVTQELAKKKQYEFGRAHFQSLQHICILTNEMTKLREENKSLKDELKRLHGTEDRPKFLKGPPREGNSTPDSPLPLLSTRSRKSSTEKNTIQEAEDKRCEPLSRPLEGDQSSGQRSSPGTRISPSIILQSKHALEMEPALCVNGKSKDRTTVWASVSPEKTPSSQRIANPSRGTIALVRPGSRSCSQERDSPPPVSKTAPSPQPEQSPSFDAYLRASNSECHEFASPYETLKFATRKEQLCLLNQHFALRHLGLRNNSSSREGGFPHHFLVAKEAGGRTRPQEEWEDQAAILELPDAMVYMKDHHLENRLQFLNPQEKLHHILMQQQGFRSRMEDSLDCTEPRAGKDCKKERTYLEDSTDGTLGKLALLNRGDVEQAEKAEAMREYLTEAPLDLSDYGRGRESMKPDNWEELTTEHEAGSPDKDQNEDSALQNTSFSSWLQVAKHLNGSKESQQPAIKDKNTAAFPTSLIPERPIAKPALGDASADQETKMSCATEKQEVDQTDNGDSESVKEVSDEPDTSDGELIGACDDESPQEVSMEEEYGCKTEHIQRSQTKRKRGQDSWTKAHKKSVQSRLNGKAAQLPEDLQEAPNGMENLSRALRPNDNQET